MSEDRLTEANLRADAFRDAWIALRQDNPRVGLFNRWADALAEATFRAALHGYRYRVTFEPNNRWWQITEAWPNNRVPGFGDDA